MRGKLLSLIAGLCLLAPLFSTAHCADLNKLSRKEKGEGFAMIFDGKTLTGWDGDPKYWSVKDGAIVGQTTPANPTPRNTFLFWTKGKLADFELRLQWKIEGGNSGIQYRSTRYDGWVAGGYQADIDAKHNYTGILYEERGRGIMVTQGKRVIRTADGKNKVVDAFEGEKPKALLSKKALMAKVKRDGWNDYTIIAKGNRLTQILNKSVTMALLDEEKAKRKLSGVLAFQVHAGPPMTVRFRNIRLKNLGPRKMAPLPKDKPKTVKKK